MADIDWAKLRRAALEAMGNAYAPYSQFPVGAAALHASGGGSLVAFACVDFRGNVLMPCGRCRQLLWEHGGPDLLVDTAEGPVPMVEVLPLAFSREDLP